MCIFCLRYAGYKGYSCFAAEIFLLFCNDGTLGMKGMRFLKGTENNIFYGGMWVICFVPALCELFCIESMRGI